MIPTSSSTPGIDRSSSASTSSRSSHVPCSMTSASGRRCSFSQRAKALGASSSTASTACATFRGFDDSRAPSASPSECAGSVETSSTRRGGRESAYAELQVVLPTPPLPAKNTRRGVGPGGWLAAFFLFEAFNVDASDLVLRRHRQRTLLRALDLANCGQHVPLDVGELLLGDFAEFEPHLCLEQLIAQRRVVVHLGLGRGDDFVEHEAEAADQQRVENEHDS